MPSRKRERPGMPNDARHAADRLRAEEERLALALSAALGARRATPGLREAIGGYVSAARAARRSWQETLAAVRALMRQAAAGQVVTDDVDALAECIFSWCEEEYAQGG
jgi:hypothetical protein